jgi:GT2 family glycosyltransferase/glycosyltransferase involved in cell wall biosynthesis
MLIRPLADALEASGHRVSIVLVTDGGLSCNDPRVSIAPAGDSAGWDTSFIATSKAAAEALSTIQKRDPIDQIEIQDFDGLAFWTLTHRRDLGVEGVPVSVRFHGPVILQTEAMGLSSPELDVASAMETESFLMADRVIAPSPGIATLLVERFAVSPERVVVGSPIVRTLGSSPRWRPDGTELLVVGRLSEVKGTHDMVDAAIPVLRQNSDVTVGFAGGDGWSLAGNRPMRDWISGRIPRDLRDRFVFLGDLSGEDLAIRIATSLVVVVPSRFESFNLGVHEARRIGAPVVVPDLPAFAGFFDQATGAITYAPGVKGLSDAMAGVAADRDATAVLAAAPSPEIGEWSAPYDDIQVDPWHLRSQGGLATAALARVESVRFQPSVDGLGVRVVREVLKRTPDSVLNLVKPLMPRRTKERIRASTNWSREEQRQRRDASWAAIVRQDADGVFPQLDPPRISVVIPCYNQGTFVRDAVASVFEQTMPDFEVVIVDDGSDDGVTPQLLAELRLERVQVITQENGGLSAARNRGIAASRGELVVTLDADDMLVPRYLDMLVPALDRNPNAAFAHCWAELFGDFSAIWATRPYNRYQLLLSNSVVGCVLLRKASWDAVGGYDETMVNGNEDWDLWIRLMRHGYGAVQVREPLFRYRKHGVSMSVETEARYEAALESLAVRLADTYSADAIVKLKHDDYPLVTVITPDAVFDPGTDDVQTLLTPDAAVGDVIGHVRGKYVVWLSEGAMAESGVVVDLCKVLEQDETLGAAETASAKPIRVVRSWSLRDIAGPSEIGATALSGSSPLRLSCGEYLDPAWVVPKEINAVPVQRQRPEEAGWTLPEVVA